jgi:putative methionine-R-sulfoxide reductase with GAF domain
MVSKLVPAVDGEDRIMQKERDSAELATAYQACLRLQQLRKPENLSSEVIDIIDSLGFKIAKIYLIDEVAGQLKSFATRTQNQSGRRGGQETIESAAIPVGEGIVGSVAKSGRAVRIGDVRRERRQYEGGRDVRSLLCVPMRVAKGVVGVVTVE